MKKSDRWMIILPVLVLFSLSIWGFFQPDKDFSDTERRALASLPKATSQNILSGKYMTEFETYSLDQFPMRDSFRSLKAAAVRYVFGKKDDHGYYVADGFLSKLEYPMNEARIKQNVQKQQMVYDTYLKDSACQIYQGIIYDKNFFLASEHGYPAMDYEAYEELVKTGCAYATFIDLKGTYELDSFYKTDQHIRQECLKEMAEALGDKMQAKVQTEYETKLATDRFYGAYKDQAALSMPYDTIQYLTNEELEHCIVTSYNTGIPKSAEMYDLKKAEGRDPYEMFSSGSDAFLVVDNPDAASEKELVLFRDSFGSSIAPLLVHGYRKVTLVDLRYVRPEVLGSLLTFTDQDVLFLYSTLVF